MKQYGKQDVADWIDSYADSVSHVIVAHTHITPFSSRKTGAQFEGYREDCIRKTSASLRHAMNCFDAMLYPNAKNKVRRNKQLYKPLVFATIEGAKETTDPKQTVHVNIMIGNLPKHIQTAQLELLFKQAWVDKAGQSSNVFVQEYEHQAGKFTGYILKEVEQDRSLAWRDNSIVDFENCYIPHQAV